MKIFLLLQIVLVTVHGPRTIVAQTDPSLTIEIVPDSEITTESVESQTEASPVFIEEITERPDNETVTFDSVQGATQAPGLVELEIVTENATLTSNASEALGSNQSIIIAHIANNTEPIISETHLMTNHTEGDNIPRVDNALQASSNLTASKDLSHDAITHFPANNITGFGTAPEDVEQIPANNQSEAIIHARDEIIHQLVNITENEVITHTNNEQPGITRADLTADLRTWVAPEFISKSFPYYLSGFDYDDRPIWIAEFGKYDMRKLVSMGPDVLEDFERYCAQAARIITDSHKWKNPDVDTISVIIDFDGLRVTQYADIPTLNFVLKLARNYAKILEQHLDHVVVINVNYVTQTLINFVRPIFAPLFRIVDFYGTDKNKWLPYLLRHYPRESLPPWYGGYDTFTPKRIFG